MVWTQSLPFQTNAIYSATRRRRRRLLMLSVLTIQSIHAEVHGEVRRTVLVVVLKLVSLPRWQCRMAAFPFRYPTTLTWKSQKLFSLSGETTVALAESQQPDMRKSKKKSHIFTWRNPGLGGAWWCLLVSAEYETYHHLPWNENLHTITSLNKFKGDTGYFNVRLNSACVLNIAALFP